MFSVCKLSTETSKVHAMLSREIQLMTTSYVEMILKGHYWLSNKYIELALGCQSITSALFKGELVKFVPCFKTIMSECNMDPASYSMRVINCTTRLARHHNLSPTELLSVQMAFQVLWHACNPPIVTVAAPVTCYPRLSSISSYCQGESGIPQKYCRWSNYQEPPVPSRKGLEEMCHKTTVYCLYVFSTYMNPVQYKAMSSTISTFGKLLEYLS
jgi:hypothetical protein